MENDIKQELAKWITWCEQQEQKSNERFNKMAAAFVELKNAVAIPERKYYVAPHTSDITNELDAAHSKCLSELKCVSRQAKGNRSVYAKVEHIVEYVNPILSKYGLSIKQLPGNNEYGDDVLITRLSHSSGQWVESRVMMKHDRNQSQNLNQQYGGSITYMRRYALLAILGIGAIDDPTDIIE